MGMSSRNNQPIRAKPLPGEACDTHHPSPDAPINLFLLNLAPHHSACRRIEARIRSLSQSPKSLHTRCCKLLAKTLVPPDNHSTIASKPVDLAAFCVKLNTFP